MSSRTRQHKRQRATAEPVENQMWEREGFDRRGIRYEFAGRREVSLEDKRVIQDDQTYVDPRTIDMPVGPTAMGGAEGSGIETVRIEGERWPVFRWVMGFELLEEDDRDVSEQRNAVMEVYDFFADVAWLTGIGPAGQYQMGAFDWLRENIPEERTFDCSTYTGGEYDDRPENLVQELALEQISGRLMNFEDDAKFSTVVGSQEALSTFNKVSGQQGGVAGDTYFERLSGESQISGVEDWNLIPESIAPTQVPRGVEGFPEDELSVDLVGNDPVATVDDDAVLGTDEVFLLPDIDRVKDELLAVYEMPQPSLWGPISLRMGKKAYDFTWRFTTRHNPQQRHPNATDCVRLTNISSVFN